MSEMIERVAMAMADKAELIWQKLSDKPDAACGYRMPEGCRDYWRGHARAAIEAMREPTEEMIEAGRAVNFGCYPNGAWDAMIDEALGKASKPFDDR